ncbi:MAG: D-alanyl-D-alanine carboxypeptidase [Erysipelotrichaceae bacterium]|nr:D-alanyl-D-alanine carboxypeptidase [Erysipelotrichaceae bacterium]
MMKKIFIILLLILLCSCRKQEKAVSYDIDAINRLDDCSEEFSFDLHSYGYMIVDLSDFDIIYSRNEGKRIYPASLTKVLTMDTVLHLADDLDDTSYVTYEQVEDLIYEDASLAYIQRDYPYSLRDLLYALVLPSGADAALALENYFSERGIDLVEQMNILAQSLGCTDSHFVNSTGLHDDDHYTTIDDLYLIVMDTLKDEEGRKILTTINHTMEDGLMISTGIRYVRNDSTDVLGGKTGYTPEAGQNLIVLYRYESRPYLLVTAGAMGSNPRKQYWHFEDALKIFELVY